MNEEQKPEINLPYIRKVLAHIEADMRRLNMRGYYYFKPDGYGYHEDEWAECGTKACFAGWGYFLSLPEGTKTHNLSGNLKGSTVRNEATKLFGFTRDEGLRIFEGEACSPFSVELQLKILKEELNAVFALRGLSDRV